MAQERSGTPNRSSNRGFASMDPERQRQIASKGGQSVPDEKRSFSQNRQLAAEAGRKGGEASHGRARARAAAARASAGQSSGAGESAGGAGSTGSSREQSAESGRTGSTQ